MIAIEGEGIKAAIKNMVEKDMAMKSNGVKKAEIPDIKAMGNEI